MSMIPSQVLDAGASAAASSDNPPALVRAECWRSNCSAITVSGSVLRQLHSTMAFDWLIDQTARAVGAPTDLALNWLKKRCRNRQVIHLFPITTLIYALLYDRLQHSYISHIYQHDKYGVVLTYALLALYDLLDLLLVAHARIIHSDGTRDQYRELNKVINHDVEIYAIMTFAKIIAFNLIFKNNTSEQVAHQRVHQVFVMVLGALALLSASNRHAVQTPGQASRATAVYALKFAAVAVTFQYMGWYTDSISYSQKWANFTTTLLESYLIELTL